MASGKGEKRIILGLGGKGGTGKTLFCRLLYYCLVENGLDVLGLDADIENPEFFQYHQEVEGHEVQQLEFLEVGYAKDFFTQLKDENPDAALLDMPGASSEATRDQIDRFGLFDIAADLGYRVTIVAVLNNGYPAIASLAAMMEHCGEQADYVVVRSELWNQGSLNYSRWDDSETRQQFKELKGIEISMPVLEISTFDVMHEAAVSFFKVAELPYGDQLLADSFVSRGRLQIRQAGRYFGLSEPERGEPAKSDKPGKAKAETVAV